MRHVMLPGVNQIYKNLALWMVIGLIVILLFTVFRESSKTARNSPISRISSRRSNRGESTPWSSAAT